MQDVWQKAYDEGVRWDADIPAYPVFELLDKAGERFENNIAMVFEGQSITYGECAEMATRLAANLQAADIGKGSRIGLMLPNSPFYLICYHGVLKAGATVVNINPLYADAELETIARDSRMEAIITLDLIPLFPKAKRLKEAGIIEEVVVCRFIDALPFPKNWLFPVLYFNTIDGAAHDGSVVLLEDLLQDEPQWHDPQINPHEDIAVLQYTGGTTGVPKAAMLTHANVVANAEQCRAWFPKAREGEDVMLAVIPFFHVFAMTAVMNLSTRLGLKIVATPRFDVTQTLKCIDRYKTGFFPSVPAIYNAILNAPDRGKYDLSALKFCISGGAPLPVSVKVRFEEEIGTRVCEGYGLSEASPVACVNPLDGTSKPGSIGVPLPQTVVEIVSVEDGKTVMPQGESGELCICGPQVMKGYWNRPEDTAAVLRDGRLHTGDVAFMDADGYVFIVDRIKDMIISNGYKVYPRHVEEAIYQHPDVEECIVAGLPHPERGEITKAWIKPMAGRTITEEAMRAFLTDKLSAMEQPRLYEFRTTALPKTLIGKPSRKDVVREETEKSHAG